MKPYEDHHNLDCDPFFSNDSDARRRSCCSRKANKENHMQSDFLYSHYFVFNDLALEVGIVLKVKLNAQYP